MEILGVGPQELIFIIIIALIVLGPKDMQKAGRTIGQWLNKIVKSDGWKAFQQTSSELRNLPTTLMREANQDLAEADKEIRKSMKMPVFPGMPLPQKPDADSAVEPSGGLTQPQETENTIQPPPANLNPQTVVSDETAAEHGSGNESNHDDANPKDNQASAPDQNA